MVAAGSWANSAVSTESTCSISIFLRELRMISGPAAGKALPTGFGHIPLTRQVLFRTNLYGIF